jgi:hypothetical protein
VLTLASDTDWIVRFSAVQVLVLEPAHARRHGTYWGHPRERRRDHCFVLILEGWVEHRHCRRLLGSEIAVPPLLPGFSSGRLLEHIRKVPVILQDDIENIGSCFSRQEL